MPGVRGDYVGERAMSETKRIEDGVCSCGNRWFHYEYISACKLVVQCLVEAVHEPCGCCKKFLSQNQR